MLLFMVKFLVVLSLSFLALACSGAPGASSDGETSASLSQRFEACLPADAGPPVAVGRVLVDGKESAFLDVMSCLGCWTTQSVSCPVAPEGWQCPGVLDATQAWQLQCRAQPSGAYCCDY